MIHDEAEREKEITSKKKFRLVWKLFIIHMILSSIVILFHRLAPEYPEFFKNLPSVLEAIVAVIGILLLVGIIIYPLASALIGLGFCIISIIYIVKRKNILRCIVMILFSLGVQIFLFYAFESFASGFAAV